MAIGELEKYLQAQNAKRQQQQPAKTPLGQFLQQKGVKVEPPPAQMPETQTTPPAKQPQAKTETPAKTETQTPPAAEKTASMEDRMKTLESGLAQIVEKLDSSRDGQDKTETPSALAEEKQNKTGTADNADDAGKKKEQQSPTEPNFIESVFPKICEDLKVPKESHQGVYFYLRGKGFAFEDATEETVRDAIRNSLEEWPLLTRSTSYPNVTTGRAKEKPVDPTKMTMGERSTMLEKELGRVH